MSHNVNDKSSKSCTKGEQEAYISDLINRTTSKKETLMKCEINVPI